MLVSVESVPSSYTMKLVEIKFRQTEGETKQEPKAELVDPRVVTERLELGLATARAMLGAVQQFSISTGGVAASVTTQAELRPLERK